VDLWAVGCILFRLLAKKPAFPPGPLLMRYCADEELFPHDDVATKISHTGVAFIKNLLQADPIKRPSAQDAMNDAWMLSSPMDEDLTIIQTGSTSDAPRQRLPSETRANNPSTSGGFQRILSRFKISLTETEKAQFQSVNIEDLYKAIDILQMEQGGKRTLLNLNRLRPFIDKIEQLRQVLDLFMSAGDYVSFIWVRVIFKFPSDELQLILHIRAH
jgi:serine/threonine protein kinase